MFNKMFRRKDVCSFIEELFKDNYRCRQDNSINTLYSIKEQIFYSFIDSLYKYYVIIETDVFLDEYIEKVIKLFRKVDNFMDINIGISKLIGNFVALKLDIDNKEDIVGRKIILNHIYKKYIENGYLFHGFSDIYKEDIIKNGFIPEQYNNLYNKFIEIDKIFNKHGVNRITEKYYEKKSVDFTDSFTKAVFYGSHSPNYFYNLFREDESDVDFDGYFFNDYTYCFNSINRLVKKYELNNYDKKFVVKTCIEEWKLLDKNNSNIDIMLVRKSKYNCNYLDNYEEIVNSDLSLGEAIKKIIYSKEIEVSISKKIDKDDIIIIEIPNFKYLFRLKERYILNMFNFKKKDSTNIDNNFGSASILALIGSIFITLGVLLTLFSILGG